MAPGKGQARLEAAPSSARRTYVLGVPGPVAQRCPGQDSNVGHKNAQQQQWADRLPGHPPEETRPPPSHAGYVITEPGTETLGSGVATRPLSQWPSASVTEIGPTGNVPTTTLTVAATQKGCHSQAPSQHGRRPQGAGHPAGAPGGSAGAPGVGWGGGDPGHAAATQTPWAMVSALPRSCQEDRTLLTAPPSAALLSVSA